MPLKRIKVHFDCPPDFGRAIRRHWEMVLRYRPPCIEVVSDGPSATVQVVPLCYPEDLSRVTNDNYVLYVHNGLGMLYDNPTEMNVLRQSFERSLLVSSWANLKADFKGNYLFARVPCGVDPETFIDAGQPRAHAIFIHGFVGTYFQEGQTLPAGEPIDECLQACARLSRSFIYAGGHREGVVNSYVEDDAQVAILYNQCQYVQGMRWRDGFECPVIEGLLCGCRPIVFNYESARFWFGDHTIMLEPDPESLEDQLATVLGTDPTPVSYEERDLFARKFAWKKVAKDFWDAVLDAL